VLVYADRIAYVNHDIDDAVRAGLITPRSLPPECMEVLGETHSRRITTMVADIISQSRGRAQVWMGERVQGATNRLKDFLFERVYQTEAAGGGEAERVRRVIEGLFRFYMDHPEEVPGGRAAADAGESELSRRVCDYLAGMTDRFASQQFQQRFLPRRWRGAD